MIKRLLSVEVFLLIAGLCLPSSVVTYADTSYPPIWAGNICNNINHLGSGQLSSQSIHRGVMACGPRGGLTEVHYDINLFGQYEWQCVKFSMRYMHLIYDITSFSVPSAKDIVKKYKLTNNTRLVALENEGTSLPSAGDNITLGLVYPNYPDGQTAVVSGLGVTNGNGNVSVIQQNATPNELGYHGAE